MTKTFVVRLSRCSFDIRRTPHDERRTSPLFETIFVALAIVAPVLAQPARLEQVGVVPGPAEIVRIQGTRAYAVLGRTLTAFDIANPAAPRRVGAHTFPDKIWGVTAAGGLVYAAVDKYGLAVLDASGPAGLALRGSFKTPGQAKSVALVGTTALVADHMSGVDFVDVSNPAKPASLGSFFLEGYARAVAAAGSIAAAVDAPTGIYLFDLTKPARLEAVGTEQSADRPVLVDVASTNGSSAPNVAVLVGSGTLQVYDISTPTAPRKVSTFRTPAGRPARVTLRNSLAYVADVVDGLVIVDLAEPASPRVVGTFKTPMPARDVAVGEGIVLVAVGRGGSSEVPPSEGYIIVLREK